MSQHLQFEIARLKRRLLDIGETVAATVQKSMIAVLERRAPLASEVISGDSRIDVGEVEIEEDCLKLLALYQPVAEDLRFIASVLRINNDLERMGDEAVNISEHALVLAKGEPLMFPPFLAEMTAATMRMLLGSLDSFVRADPAAARSICAADDEIDEYNRAIIESVSQIMRRDANTIEQAMRLFSVSRHLERIADHATNIAEDVVYMVEGIIIRHHHGEETRLDRAPQR